MKSFIYLQDNWPQFKWDSEELIGLLGLVRNLQGKVVGKMESLGFDLRNEATLQTLTLDVIKTTEIEGVILNPDQVRSSVARRLGMDISGLVPSDRDVDGVVDMMIDAIVNSDKELNKERLFDWHYSLFPSGRSGMYKIIVGNWRDDTTGPMQVVSGPLGKEKVHYQAPDAKFVDSEMQKFLYWINHEDKIDLVLKAGLAHLWFLTIHPFEDGNGRIARAIADMILTRADGIKQRFYSMSSQIRIERKDYYAVLEKTQKSTLDVTDWLKWFLNCLFNSIQASETVLATVLYKHKFWNKYATQTLNDRQILMLNKIIDGFDGKVTTSKWAKINKCSNDTALRDIQDLINKQILSKEGAGGRSSSYEINTLSPL